MKLKVENPAFEKGLEIDVPGVGLVKNGATVDLGKAELEAYVARVGRKPNEPTGAVEETTDEKAEEGGN